MAINDSEQRGYRPDGGLVPIPDPSLLTTQALAREIAGLKELNAVQLKAIEERINDLSVYSRQRGADIDAATKVIQRLLDEKIARNADISNEKFEGIKAQFVLNDTALKAAFSAQKELGDDRNRSNSEAIKKSESAFNDSLKQLANLSNTENKGMKEQVDDLKEAMASMRGAHSGAKDFWGYVIGAIGILVAVGTLVVLVLRAH